MDPEAYMREALALAREAGAAGDVPVGCVIADPRGNIIGRGQNRRERDGDATAHGEMAAIGQACRALGGWRLTGCSLFVTLEPCPMCAGAILLSRISRLYFGAREPVTGACGSVLNLFMEPFGHSPEIVGGVLEDQCAALLRAFFSGRRE